MLRASGEDPGDAWVRAIALWERLERPLPVLCALRHAAEGCLARGRRDEAADAAGRALVGARRLGAGWLVTELERLIARARLSVDAALAAGADGGGGAGRPAATGGAGSGAGAGAAGGNGAGVGADDTDPFGLTPRERQVLALVARGATNREIGTELFMAEKTASVHVSRILAKLDVRSRTEAAAVAHRLGIEAGGDGAPAAVA
jgi:DNA-binding CsgD family transcriptional regulator